MIRPLFVIPISAFATTLTLSVAVAQVSFQAQALAPIQTSAGAMSSTTPTGAVPIPFAQEDNVGGATRAGFSLIPLTDTVAVRTLSMGLIGSGAALSTGPIDLVVDVVVGPSTRAELEISSTNVVFGPNSTSTLDIDVGNDGTSEIVRATTMQDVLTVPLPAGAATTIPVRIRTQSAVSNAMSPVVFQRGFSDIVLRAVPTVCSVSVASVTQCGTFFITEGVPTPQIDGGLDFTVEGRANTVQLLVLGFGQSPTAFPVPLEFGTCTLNPTIDLVVAYPTSVGGPSTIAFSPTAPLSSPVTLFAQTLRFDSGTGFGALSQTFQIDCP